MRALDAIDQAVPVGRVVHGNAGKYETLPDGSKRALYGADALAGRWALERGGIDVQARGISDEDWDKYGDMAGPIRNNAMLTEFKPELFAVVAFRGATGTQHMRKIARKAGILVVQVLDDNMIAEAVHAMKEKAFAQACTAAL